LDTNQIELADNGGVQQRKSFNLMSKEVGGRTNLGFTRLDQMIFGEKEKEVWYKEKLAIYCNIFRNPSFYHAYQLDIEDKITNILFD
jgi:hypothetical protein